MTAKSVANAFEAQTRAVATAWAREPDGVAAAALLVEHERVDANFRFPSSIEDPAPGWGLSDVLRIAISLGAEPLPPGDVLPVFLDVFKWEASLALAAVLVEQTGIDPRIVADHVQAPNALQLDTAPPDVLKADEWLIAHWGGNDRRSAAARFLGTAWRGALLDLALAEADQRELVARKPPTLRRGTHLLRTLLTTDRHVQAAMKKLSGRLSPDEAEYRRLFKYEPLGAAERLVMHALATHARAIGALDSHPWATASGAMPKKLGEEPPRVLIDYPGTSEIARILGYSAGADGKISRARRTTIEHAIRDLIAKPRWIAMRVLLPPTKKDGRWIEDIEVRREAWIVPSMTMREGAKRLELHPAAIASHLKSFEDIPDLAARYDAARDALGARELRDEWAIADDYVRYLALNITAKMRRDGEIPARRGATAGDMVLPKRLSFDTLTATLGLTSKAKKQGKPWTRERIREALAFCKHMGSIKSFEEDATVGMYDLVLPYPDSAAADDDQLLLLTPEFDSPD